MSGIVIGIDPGLTGAVSAITPQAEYVGVHDLPVIRDGSVGWIDGGELVSIIGDLRGANRVMRAFVEKSQAMPGQGVSSSFQIGVTFGSIVSALQCMGVPVEFVSAAHWKRQSGLSTDKRASLDRARMWFPDAPLTLYGHHNRAEALLIAAWGAQRINAPVRGRL